MSKFVLSALLAAAAAGFGLTSPAVADVAKTAVGCCGEDCKCEKCACDQDCKNCKCDGCACDQGACEGCCDNCEK